MNKKRKVTEAKEEAYQVAWESIKANIEKQGASGTSIGASVKYTYPSTEPPMYSPSGNQFP